jgi:hypothetical protein
MADVASLGLSIDSSQVTRGTSALDGLSSAAARAQGASTALGGAAAAAARSESALGASTRTTTDALSSQAEALRRLAANQNTAAANASRLAASQRALSGQTGNIAAQFQDIGVQLASGTSPFLIALQQGTQLSAVLGTVGGGVAGVGAALKVAFLSVISPVSLLTIGIIAAGGALFQYFTSANKQAENTNAALKKHSELINAAAQKWGDAVPPLKQYNDELQRTVDLQNLQTALEARRQAATDKISGAYNKFLADNAGFANTLQLASVQPASALHELGVTFEDLQNKIAAGTATVDDFRKVQEEAGKAAAATGRSDIKDLAEQFRQFVEPAASATQTLIDFNAALNTAIRTQTSLQTLIQGSTFVDDKGAIRGTNEFLPRNGAALPSPELQYQNSPDGLVPTEALKAGGSEADGVNKAAVAYKALVNSQNASLEKLRLESQLIGASVEDRNRQTAALQAEQDLRTAGIDLLSKEGEAYIANAKAMADAKTQIDRQNAAYQSLQQAEGSLIDSLVDGATTVGSSWKETFANMAKQAADWFAQMAIANPLKNALTNTNLPTFSDLLSGKPTIPGATSTATMTVTAAVVNLNGGLSGTPGATGGGLLGLLTDAAKTNGVRPGVGTTLPVPGAANSNTDVAAYIQQAALKRGIDPATALAVAKSEGGLNSWNLQSQYVKNGVQEPSFGPYQLYMGGGLGNDFQAQTGLDPRLAANGPAGVDFALDHAKANGWSSWYGAKNTGISQWQGINPGQMPQTDAAAKSLTALSTSAAKSATDVTGLGESTTQATSSLSNLFGGSGTPSATGASSGGGLFSWLGSLFGFDTGGYTGDGGRNDPAGVVHRGEVVWSQADVRRAGGVATVEAMRRGRPGLANGGHLGGNYVGGGIPQSPGNDNSPRKINVSVEARFVNDGKFSTYVTKVAEEKAGNAHAAARRDMEVYDTERLPNRMKEISDNPYGRG